MAAFDPRYYGIPPSQQILTENRYPYTATAAQTTFAAVYTIGYVDVYYNGSHLDPRTSFTAADGVSIVLTDPADAGASVVIVARPQVPVNNVYSQAQVDALTQAFYANVVTGTADALIATTVPSFSSFTDGMQVKVRMGSLINATATPTIAFNGLPAKTIVGQSQAALAVAAWQANAEITLRYNITTGNFVLWGGVAPTVGQVQSGSLYSAVAGGTSDALTATFSPAITAVANQTILVRAGSANATTTPTINPGSGAITIVKGNNLPLAIGDIAGAGHWLELSLDATMGVAVLQNPASGVAIKEIIKRQTVMSGPTDVNGLANEIGTGSGLTPTLNGSVTPVAMTFAAGFGPNGAVDHTGYVNSSLSFPALPASNLSFLTVDRNASTGALTLGSTLAPVQYGTTYNQAAQSVLQFGGAAGSTTFLDDFGNTWTAQGGAKVQTNQFKFGTGALGGGGTSNALNGTTDFLLNTTFTTFGNGSWSMRGWAYHTTLSTGVFGAWNSSGYGATLTVSSSGKVTLNLSSTGSSWDIANNTQTGAATIATGSYNYFELTFDSVAGKYVSYVNGVADQTIISSAKICGALQMRVGAATNNVPSTTFMIGYLDKFEYLPYCQHPNGTTYAVPTAAPNVATQGYASDWVNTANYTMNQVSAASTVAGTNPTFTAKQRLYVGEAVTGSSAVSSVVSYAYNRAYTIVEPTLKPGTTRISKNHNLGVVPSKFAAKIRVVGTTQGYSSNDEIDICQLTNTSLQSITATSADRLTIGVVTNTGGLYIMTKSSGTNAVLDTTQVVVVFYAETTW